MDIYSFIPSRDIEEHCRKIGRDFNPLECAVIISNSDKTLAEKHAAYQYIIDNMLDMSIPESLHWHYHESLHDVLRSLLEWETAQIKRFEDYSVGSESFVYLVTARINGEPTYSSINDNKAYSTPEKALDALREHWERDEVDSFKISKVWVDSEKCVEFYMTYDGEYIFFYTNDYADITEYPLDLIFIDVPVPFVKGDIVAIKGTNTPYVLDMMPQFDKRYPDHVSGKLGDGSDFMMSGYSYDEEFALYCDHTNPNDGWRVEYYRGDLTGRDKFLKYLSEYIKSGDKALDWIIALYLKFEYEEQHRKYARLFGGWYLSLEKEPENSADEVTL
jgi:hypothetical protein